MSRASNSLKATDVTATPIKLKYSASYSNTSICDSGIYGKSGVNGPVTITGSVPAATLRYWSIRHLYYSNYLTGSYQTTTSSFDNFLQQLLEPLKTIRQLLLQLMFAISPPNLVLKLKLFQFRAVLLVKKSQEQVLNYTELVH